MIKWGQKSKPKKIHWASHKTPKIPCRISEPLNFPESIKWFYTKIETSVSNTPQKSLFKSSYQENTCQNFPTPKIPKSKISNTKKTFDHPFTWNPLPPPPDQNTSFQSTLHKLQPLLLIVSGGLLLLIVRSARSKRSNLICRVSLHLCFTQIEDRAGVVGREKFGDLNSSPRYWNFTSVPVDSSPHSYLFTSCRVRIPVHTAPRCGKDPNRYVSLYFRDRCGATSLRYRNSVKITFLKRGWDLYPFRFSCRHKSYLAGSRGIAWT